MSGFHTRLAALTRKETRQLLRDPSRIAIGVSVPAANRTSTDLPSVVAAGESMVDLVPLTR